MNKALYIIILFLLLFPACSKEVMTPTGEAVRIQISPDTATLAKGNTKKFSVIAYDANNSQVPVKPSWSVENNVGTVDSKGHFFVNLDAPGPFPRSGYLVASYNGITAKALINVLLAPLGVYTETYPQLQYDTVQDYYNPDAVVMAAWGGAVLSSATGADEYTDGTAGLKTVITAAGGGFIKYGSFDDPLKWDGPDPDVKWTNQNLLAYSNGSIEFDVKANAKDFHLKIEWDTTPNVNPESGAYNRLVFGSILGIAADREWHHVSIPINSSGLLQGGGFNLKYVSVVFGWYADASLPVTNYLDNIYYKPPAQ